MHLHIIVIGIICITVTRCADGNVQIKMYIFSDLLSSTNRIVL